LPVKFCTIRENLYFLVFLRQTAIANLKLMCDSHLDPLVLMHGFQNLKSKEIFDEGGEILKKSLIIPAPQFLTDVAETLEGGQDHIGAYVI
jgi:hypothetical protein